MSRMLRRWRIQRSCRTASFSRARLRRPPTVKSRTPSPTECMYPVISSPVFVALNQGIKAGNFQSLRFVPLAMTLMRTWPGLGLGMRTRWRVTATLLSAMDTWAESIVVVVLFFLCCAAIKY
ncbi:hypothetical protein BDV23DRAFT_153998, partial [Aspergillus alliaceus]